MSSSNGRQPGVNPRHCHGVNKRGKPCGRAPLKGSDYCWMHDATRQQEMAESTSEWKQVFLDSLEAQLTISGACEAAGVNRSTVYRARQQDEVFAVAWHDLKEGVIDRVERRALTMALGGDARMIEMLLKAHRPGDYDRERKVKHSGQVDHSVRGDPLQGVNPADLPPADQKKLAEIMERARPIEGRELPA